MIRMPEDVDLLERLNTTISAAMNDNDADISALARSCNEVFKKVPLRMAGGGTSMSGDGNQAAFEAEDRRKEEEEVEFAFTPEEVKE